MASKQAETPSPLGEKSPETLPTDERSDLLLSRESSDLPTLSVILPTLNEEDGISECITAIKSALTDLGITGEIIVSDSSTDRTPEIARDHGAYVVRPDQNGYGYAYRYAFPYARGDYIVIGDADTTYDFTELPKLLQPVIFEHADIALGTRLKGDIQPGAMPILHRYVGNPLLTKFLNVFYDAGVTDAHSGFRVISRQALEKLELRSTGMEFASEMVMDAAAKGLTITEVPITYSERTGDETLQSFRDGWRHVRFMLMNAPGFVFSIPSTFLGVLGIIAMTISLAGLEIGGVTFGTHTMIAGSLLTITAYQIASLAVFSSIAADPIRRPGDSITEWVRTTVKFEHGTIVGAALFFTGGSFLAYVAGNWLVTGHIGFELLVWNLLAFTLVVLGVQTVFSTIFLSMIGEHRARTPIEPR